MKITICGSIKFFDEMVGFQKQLKANGHEVFMPIKVVGVDYWSEDGKSRIEAKKGLGLVNEHLNKIEKSDAILVANYTKGDIKNYIGANTFIEMAFAHHNGNKIFILNPLPNQKYINDELVSFDGIVLNGDLNNIK
ncbi:MAG: hypothetical protein AAB350_00305 [Patescibacteria group bacterium]|mgnify:CR=1 FL=1